MQGSESDVEKWLNAHPFARDAIVVGVLFVCFVGMDILFSRDTAVLDGIRHATFILVTLEATWRLTGDSLFEYCFQNRSADSSVKKWLEEHPFARDLVIVVSYMGMFTAFLTLSVGEVQRSVVLLSLPAAIVMLIIAEATARSRGNSIFQYDFRGSVPK